MKNWVKQNQLQSLAIVIWLLISASVIAKEMIVFSTVRNFGNQFLSLNQFFDDAKTSFHQDWGKWEKEFDDFDKRFDADSNRFHAYVEKHTQEMLGTLGYNYENGVISLKESPPKPPTKPFKKIESEWVNYMTACKFGDGSRKSADAYVKCLEKQSKKQN